jgi:hypothetical protein
MIVGVVEEGLQGRDEKVRLVTIMRMHLHTLPRLCAHRSATRVGEDDVFETALQGRDENVSLSYDGKVGRNISLGTRECDTGERRC